MLEKLILLIVQKEEYRLPICHLIEYACKSMIKELENKFNEAFNFKIDSTNNFDYSMMIKNDNKDINTIYNSLIEQDEIFHRSVSIFIFSTVS